MCIAVEPNPSSLGSTCSPSAALITATRKLVTSGTAVQACTERTCINMPHWNCKAASNRLQGLNCTFSFFRVVILLYISFSVHVCHILLCKCPIKLPTHAVSPTRAVLQALACRCQITSVPVRQDAYRPSSTSSDTAVGHCLHQCRKYRS